MSTRTMAPATPRRRPIAYARVLALPLVAGALVAASGAPDGLTFTLTSTTRSADGTTSSPSKVLVRSQGAVMRFDPVAEKAGNEGDGRISNEAYTLVDAQARAIRIVIPERKQYVEWSMDSATTAAMQVAAATTVVSDFTVKAEPLGAGGSVEGMNTRRVRVTTQYAYHEGSADRQGRATITEEYWVSDAMKGVMDPVEHVARALGGKGGYGSSPFAAVGGGQSLGALLAKRAEVQRDHVGGMPVKTETHLVDVGPDGEKEESWSTTIVSGVQRGALDAALFAVPAGYTRLTLKDLMNVSLQLRNAITAGLKRRADGTVDSTSLKDAAVQGAKEGAKEGVREGARDAARRGLRGLIRKP